MTNQNLASNFDWGKLGEKYLSQFGPAVAGGLLAGKMQQDYLDRQPAFPEDQTSINFQTAAEAMADPNLRFKPKLEDTQLAAEGGRIGAQEGGLMNLGGMEKDYRQEGGFVPIGGKE